MTSLLSDSPYCTIVHWRCDKFWVSKSPQRNSDLHVFDSAALWPITCSRTPMRYRIIFESMPSKWRFRFRLHPQQDHLLKFSAHGMMALGPNFSFAMLSIWLNSQKKRKRDGNGEWCNVFITALGEIFSKPQHSPSFEILHCLPVQFATIHNFCSEWNRNRNRLRQWKRKQ